MAELDIRPLRPIQRRKPADEIQHASGESSAETIARLEAENERLRKAVRELDAAHARIIKPLFEEPAHV